MQFFGFYLRLNPFKINKKNRNNGRGARVDATWHARPRGSAMGTHAAPTWRGIYFILYIYYLSYINGSSAFPIWEGLLTL